MTDVTFYTDMKKIWTKKYSYSFTTIYTFVDCAGKLSVFHKQKNFSDNTLHHMLCELLLTKYSKPKSCAKAFTIIIYSDIL